ncbi:hypothetical protein [Roseobacter sp. GAI101]|uniref:hypothetical protein n=1 Tax=Roseobacter sp. (strain GAI101) TaxID=391589 RepID=UPI0001871E13|nr:hypothetical protein [Roseobacter sp. GAI101]EEB85224.1 hypothetical protein RGAI101_2375 [Roseobacter sp. GAI101]
MTYPDIDIIRAFLFSIAAAVFFTAGFLASKDAFLPNLPPFSWLYALKISPLLKTILIGASFSALGMVCAGVGFNAKIAVAAPTLATAGLLGNIFAGMYLGNTPISAKIVYICAILIVATVLLVDAVDTNSDEENTRLEA